LFLYLKKKRRRRRRKGHTYWQENPQNINFYRSQMTAPLHILQTLGQAAHPHLLLVILEDAVVNLLHITDNRKLQRFGTHNSNYSSPFLQKGTT